MYPNPNPGQMKRSCRALRYMYAYATITQHIALLHWVFEDCAFNFTFLSLILSNGILALFSRHLHTHKQPIFNPQRETTADREAEKSHMAGQEKKIFMGSLWSIHIAGTHNRHSRSLKTCVRITGRSNWPYGQLLGKASMSECSKPSDACGRYVSRIRIVPFIHSPSVFVHQQDT